MSDELFVNGYKVDAASQRMLRALRGGKWHRATTLRKAADLNDNRQVTYRVEEYLYPSGLVVEQGREKEKEGRRFKLTEGGATWVEEHAEELLMPSTHEEVVELAYQGYKEGTEAKDSVQSYRKKLSRTKNRLDEVRDDVETILDGRLEDAGRLETIEKSANGAQTLAQENNKAVEELEESVATRASAETVSELQEAMRDAEEQLSRVEAKQEGFAQQQAEARREHERRRRLVEPARYVAALSLLLYSGTLVGAVAFAPDLAASVVIGGVGGLLAVAFGGAVVAYALGTNLDATYRTVEDITPAKPSRETR